MGVPKRTRKVGSSAVRGSAPRQSRYAGPRRDDRILDVAARLFRERGFAGTGLREIAKAAGMLPGSLHYRYATKEALVTALAERGVDRAIRQVSDAIRASTDPIERMRLGIAAHIRVLLSRDDAVYVLLFDWQLLDGGAREAIVRVRNRYHAFWDGITYPLLGAGVLRDDLDAKLMSRLAWGAINWTASWYREGGHLSPDDIAAAAVEFLSHGMLVRPPTHRRARASRRRE